jgi:prepilin-type processing-associated H-X9-DG protein
MEQDNIFRIYRTPITGVSQTDGMNNHTATDPQIVQARQAQVKTYFCPSRRRPTSLSQISSGSPVTGMPSDYAACTGDTSTVPTPGVFQLVNSNHLLSVTTFADITDGTSNTFMIGEKHIQLGMLNNFAQDGVIYSGSENNTYHRRAGASNPLAINLTVNLNSQFGSWHPGVCNFVFADGSVRAIRNSTPGTTLALYANRADGLVIPE